MTDQTTTTPTQVPSEQQLVYDAGAAIVTLVGMFGVAVPAIFHDQSVMYAAAGALLTLGGSLYSLYRHFVKSNVISTQAAKIALSAKPVAAKRLVPRTVEEK